MKHRIDKFDDGKTALQFFRDNYPMVSADVFVLTVNHYRVPCEFILAAKDLFIAEYVGQARPDTGFIGFIDDEVVITVDQLDDGK